MYIKHDLKAALGTCEGWVTWDVFGEYQGNCIRMEVECCHVSLFIEIKMNYFSETGTVEYT